MSTLVQRSVLDASGFPLDQIQILGIAARGFHGVLESEREAGQDFSADVTLYLDTRAAARDDDLDETVNYALVAQDVVDILSGEPVDLIETVAEQIAAAVLDRPLVSSVDVTVHKPQAPIPVPFSDVTVTINRDRLNVPVVPSPVAPALDELPASSYTYEPEVILAPPAPVAAPLPAPVELPEAFEPVAVRVDEVDLSTEPETPQPSANPTLDLPLGTLAAPVAAREADPASYSASELHLESDLVGAEDPTVEDTTDESAGEGAAALPQASASAQEGLAEEDLAHENRVDESPVDEDGADEPVSDGTPAGAASAPERTADEIPATHGATAGTGALLASAEMPNPEVTATDTPAEPAAPAEPTGGPQLGAAFFAAASAAVRNATRDRAPLSFEEVLNPSSADERQATEAAAEAVAEDGPETADQDEAPSASGAVPATAPAAADDTATTSTATTSTSTDTDTDTDTDTTATTEPLAVPAVAGEVWADERPADDLPHVGREEQDAPVEESPEAPPTGAPTAEELSTEARTAGEGTAEEPVAAERPDEASAEHDTPLETAAETEYSTLAPTAGEHDASVEDNEDHEDHEDHEGHEGHEDYEDDSNGRHTGEQPTVEQHASEHHASEHVAGEPGTSDQSDEDQPGEVQDGEPHGDGTQLTEETAVLDIAALTAALEAPAPEVLTAPATNATAAPAADDDLLSSTPEQVPASPAPAELLAPPVQGEPEPEPEPEPAAEPTHESAPDEPSFPEAIDELVAPTSPVPVVAAPEPDGVRSEGLPVQDLDTTGLDSADLDSAGFPIPAAPVRPGPFGDLSEPVGANLMPLQLDRMDARPDGPVDAVLALGANLGDAQGTLRRAVAELETLTGVEVVEVGPLARTAAVGGPEQPDFLNTVVIVRTTLSPRELMLGCQSVEAGNGRVRDVRWGPRTLDIDIVVFGDVIGSAPDLELPHPRANERAFVLAPWAHLDPDAHLPGLGGGPVAMLAATAHDREGIRWLALDWLHDAEVPTAAQTSRPATVAPALTAVQVVSVSQPDTGDHGPEQPGTEQPGTEQPGTEQPGTEEPGAENIAVAPADADPDGPASPDRPV